METREEACEAVEVRWISEESREWGEAPRRQVGASEREGRRPLAVGVGRPEAGVGVARVGEARRPVWRSHADAASGGTARDCEWGNGEAGSRVTGWWRPLVGMGL